MPEVDERKQGNVSTPANRASGTIAARQSSPFQEKSPGGSTLETLDKVLKHTSPCCMPVAAMVADLENSDRIASELPTEEYFELVNGIWQASQSVLRACMGTVGKHPADGLSYYFFPGADSDYRLRALRCALELQQLMADINRGWQQRKGWLNELRFNIGLHAGQDWIGHFHAGSHVEFRVLGESTQRASQLSAFARDGSIWATKSMLSQMSASDRHKITFGISRRLADKKQVFVQDSYANLGSELRDQDKTDVFRADERLSVCEVRAIRL